jgi:hypothetical protein
VDLRDLFENLWRRRRAVCAAVVFATFAAFAAIFRIDVGVPPHVEKRPVETGAGAAQLVLDSPRSPILKAGVPLEGLTNRAAVLTNFVQSPAVVQRISEILAIPVEKIGTRGAPPSGLTRGREIDADQRATELTAEEAPYRIYATSSEEAPVISLYTRAPDPAGAVRLAKAATTALTAWVEEAEERHGIPVRDRVQVRPLGPPQADWVNRGARYMLAGLAFVGALAAWVLLMTIARRVAKALKVDNRNELLPDEDDRWLGRSTISREPPLAMARPAEARPARDLR